MSGFFVMDINAPIGIFDSGIGGLTVAKAVKDLLPNESILYFGDTLHLPYGEKSAHSIQKYSANIAEFMLNQGCKAILIACNSASSIAFESTLNLLPDQYILLNVIDPLVSHVIEQLPNKHIGVIGTKATINSKVYQNKLSSHCSVAPLATPLLAPMIEEGFIKDNISNVIINNYLNNDQLKDIDALLLGCTHYPLIKPVIEKNYQKDQLLVLDSSIWIAQELANKLRERGWINTHQSNQNKDEFYVSDLTQSFEESARFFFGSEIQLQELKIT